MNEPKKYPLDSTWNLQFTDPNTHNTLKTTVDIPSNIEPTLQKLGLLADYMPADRISATAKFEIVDDWTYSTAFDAPASPKGWKRELVFEGIDNISEVYLNGKLILNTDNIHYTYRVDIEDQLKKKGNDLKVIIRSSELWARKHLHEAYGCYSANASTQSYLRKPRHQWGWDNAPYLITSGIVRPVYIEAIPPCYFEDVYFYTKNITDKNVALGVMWKYQTDCDYVWDHKLKVSVIDGDRVIFEKNEDIYYTQGTVNFSIPREKIELWWPLGFGDAKLYTLKLDMEQNGNKTADHEMKIGIRTLRLERTEDILADGTGEFVFKINREKIFIRGTNWKPLRPLCSEADAETKTFRALEEAKMLNCNMIRIWGGGIYESREFFDWCDKNGMMVWQDFMFACEIPPVDDDFCARVNLEAEQIIKKQRNHPSLAIWCGDNENDVFCNSFHSNNETIPSQIMKISRTTLKNASLRLDPYRSYIESSPFVSDHYARETQNKVKERKYFLPEEHLYPPVPKQKEVLRKTKSFFIGETGPIKMNAIAINSDILAREKTRAKRLWNEANVAFRWIHQLDEYFISWRNAGKEACIDRYGRDFTFDEWKDYTLAINVICAEVFKDIIEYCRVSRWTKTGVLWWSLMDMWPMLFNYSVMDWQYNRKLPWYWIRQSQQEFALMAVQKKLDEELCLYAVNDTLNVHIAEYSVTAYNEDGTGRVIATGICKQTPNSSKIIQSIAVSDSPELWMIKWIEGGKTYTNHVFTANTTYETTRRWIEIIGKESGFYDEILEFVHLNN